jgi:hypothetical protein
MPGFGANLRVPLPFIQVNVTELVVMLVNEAPLTWTVGVEDVVPFAVRNELVRYSVPLPVPLYSNTAKKYCVEGVNPVRKKLVKALS